MQFYDNRAEHSNRSNFALRLLLITRRRVNRSVWMDKPDIWNGQRMTIGPLRQVRISVPVGRPKGLRYEAGGKG